MTLKLLFTASLFDVQQYGDSVGNKPASFLVVPLVGFSEWCTGGQQLLSKLVIVLRSFFFSKRIKNMSLNK